MVQENNQCIVTASLEKGAEPQQVECLRNLALTMKDISEFPEQAIRQGIKDKTISDEHRIIIMRAMIYNPQMRPYFYEMNEELTSIIECLIKDNGKINHKISKPFDGKVKSCAGDTLMHCAGRMGYTKLMYHLYNAGAGDSLSMKNSHGYTPVASISNQKGRIAEWGNQNPLYPHVLLTPAEQAFKNQLLYDLDAARKTYHDLIGEETLLNSKLTRDAIVPKEFKTEKEVAKTAFTEAGHSLISGNKLSVIWNFIIGIAFWMKLKKIKKNKDPMIDEAQMLHKPPYKHQKGLAHRLPIGYNGTGFISHIAMIEEQQRKH